MLLLLGSREPNLLQDIQEDRFQEDLCADYESRVASSLAVQTAGTAVFLRETIS